MKKNFTPKYKYYTNNKDIVVAVVRYAGKPVRCVARLDPRDEFDLEKGKRIAKARCELKVADMRIKKGKKREAYYELLKDDFLLELIKAQKYLEDALRDKLDAEAELDKIFAEN